MWLLHLIAVASASSVQTKPHVVDGVEFGRRVSAVLLVVAVLATSHHAKGAAPAPLQPFQDRSEAEIARITFVTGAQRKPVNFEFINGTIVFKVRVEGRDAWAILDNAAASLISDRRARELRLLEKARPAEDGLTAQGSLRRSAVGHVKIEVPGQASVRLPTHAADLGAIDRNVGRPIDFLLGRDFFRGLGFAVSMRNKQFNFGPSGGFTPPAHYVRIDLRGAEGLVAGRLNGKDLLLKVDLGFNGGVGLKEDVWKDVPVTSLREPYWITTLDGSTKRRESDTLAELQVGDLTFNDVHACNCPPFDAEADALLGTRILRRANFILDIGANVFWVHAAQER